MELRTSAYNNNIIFLHSILFFFSLPGKVLTIYLYTLFIVWSETYMSWKLIHKHIHPEAFFFKHWFTFLFWLPCQPIKIRLTIIHLHLKSSIEKIPVEDFLPIMSKMLIYSLFLIKMSSNNLAFQEKVSNSITQSPV